MTVQHSTAVRRWCSCPNDQGTVSGTGGGGDLVLDNATLTQGQTVEIGTWSYTEGNS